MTPAPDAAPPRGAAGPGEPRGRDPPKSAPPVRPRELILGKMGPYIALTLLEFCLIAALMRLIFRVARQWQPDARHAFTKAG